MTTAGTIAGVGGRVAGGVLGGAIGSVFGPVGLWIGRAVGSRVGGMAAKAAAEALASYMEEANDDAETQTKDDEAAVPCEDCGDIGCFKPKKGATAEDNAEMERQLKEQQDAINDIPPDQLVNNMESYEAAGRGASDAASRAAARNDWISETAAELMESGMSEPDAVSEAKSRARTMDVIHTPDLSAGGTGDLSSYNRGLASKGVNRSIGSQWSKKAPGADETRLEQLKKHAEQAHKRGEKMNVKLKMCDDKSEEDPDDTPEPEGGDGGASGQGNVQSDDIGLTS
ncbi:polymorphic toxin type 15 domain-containing protein [Afifella sp. YEN Y35]|uniref:polymorphic toxin type 15 domain-containing protein n=1 Tax=Afifella sp. YEN Y35 TaxID=3388337 RepID=UPI0039E0B951